jgi:radical SAM superfamily enzyme YgiQ (UPF0313 family)
MTVELVSCCYERGNFSFPLGALCVQEALRQAGIPSHLSNCYLSDDPRKAASRISADVVGISVYLWNRSWFDQFVTALKKRNPQVILFAGGTEVTANPMSFDLSLYRFLILGEGEESVPRALTALKEGKEIPSGGGIATKGSLLIPGCPEHLEDLSSVLLSHTADPFLKQSDTVLWELTRGCPYHCAFCFESKGVRSVRHYPMDRITNELDYLVSHHVRHVFVLDPTFNMDKKRTKEILSLLVEKAPDIHFTFENRAELLDEEMVRLYGQLDCSLQLGMQSSDPVVLKAIDRAANMTAFENGVRMLVKEGVSFGLDVIIGLPGDTLEGFFHSLDYAISLKPNNIDLFLLSLLPGTTLADRTDRLGLRHQEQNPYLLIESPTFPKEDIATALSVKTAVDLFYTKGQAYQWFPLLEEAGGMKAHQLMLDFATFLTTQHPEETDVYELQDRFVKKVLKRQGKTSFLPALTSYMELYQGIAFLLETGESPIVQLQYDPNDLTKLEQMPLSQFTKEVKRRPCTLSIIRERDGSVGFLVP